MCRVKRCHVILFTVCLVEFGFTVSFCAQVLSITPKRGSLNGGTRLTVHGKDFSQDNYNNGNIVKLVSTTKVYDCPVHKDGTTEVMIMCYTPKYMVEGSYHVRVEVDGEEIPLSSHCNNNPNGDSCTFTVAQSNTPVINNVFPATQSHLPGEFVQLSGKLFSVYYGSNIPAENMTNGITERIMRVYANAQLCLLRGDEDLVYGLELNSPSSYYGYMKCLTKGSYVGNTNASFIIEGHYGRSLPDADLLRVSYNDDIYMFQTYAKITSISPSSGSVRGGTLITINGQFFDETKSAAKVILGGTECEIVGNVTADKIVCRTAAESSAHRYSGNRGLIIEIFNETSYGYSDLPNVLDLLPTAPDYSSHVLDHFHFIEWVMDQYVTRTHGYFIPPHSGEYTLYIRADDFAILYLSSDDNPANKVQIASSPGYTTGYFRFNEQASNRMYLERGKYYYIEAIHAEQGQGSEFKVAARHWDTKFTDTMVGKANNEKQMVTVTTTVTKEIQQVTLKNQDEGSVVYEVQEVTIIEDVGEITDAKYQLGLYGVYTTPLLSSADEADISTALNQLAFLDTGESINVTASILMDGSQGAKLLITFKSERGDFPLLDVVLHNGTYEEPLTVTVTEVTKGVPSGKYFVLTMESVPSPPIPATASADEMSSAMNSLFGTRCPTFLTKPDGIKFLFDMEAHIPGIGGTKTNEVEPFCGQYSVRNPSSVIKNTKGIQLSSKVKTLCFGYQGLGNNMWLSYTFENDLEVKYKVYDTFNIAFDSSPGWHYVCLDLLDILGSFRPGISYFWLHNVIVYKRVQNFYLDNVYLGESPTTKYPEFVNTYRMVSAKPNNAIIRSVSVSSPTAGVYSITLDPYECGSKFPLFEYVPEQLRSGSITVDLIQKASPPITGSYGVTFRNKTKSGLSYKLSAGEIKAMLETIEGIGDLTVEKNGDCANFDFTLRFNTLAGDHPLIQIDSSKLKGTQLTVHIKTLQNGGLWYDPIPGDMLRTDNQKPQVMAYINDIPTLCSGDCTFEWSLDATPQIASITPTSGTAGMLVTISGTNLGPSASDNEITIGHAPCIPQSGDSSSVECITGDSSYGDFNVDVTVAGKGLAAFTSGDVIFRYLLGISGIIPTAASLGGGIPLTITGYGFSVNSSVSVGGRPCDITESTSTQIVCDVPSSAAGMADVVVTMDGHTETSATKFQYDPNLSPIISMVTPVITTVEGGSILTITGTNLGTSGVLKIGSTVVPTETFNVTEVMAILPSLPPGIHQIVLLSGDDGAAVDSDGNIPTIEYQLEITNVFPRSGSVQGGTRLTLTGQGFSTNTSIVEVTVGNFPCVIDSITPTEIICTIQETSNVIRIDNQGVHPTWGIGYEWNPKVAHAHVGDIIEWTWTTPSWIKSFTHRVEQTMDPISTKPAVDGFVSSSTGTKNGKFRYKVTSPGEYNYWSGYCDYYEIVYYRGVLLVEEKPPSIADVILKVAGQTALHKVNSGTLDPTDSDACPGQTSTIADCIPEPTPDDSSRFTFLFDPCHTPIVIALSRNNATRFDTVSVIGLGFTSTPCIYDVTFGDAKCLVTFSNATVLQCSVDPSNAPTIGLMQDVNVHVKNLGSAVIDIPGKAARTLVVMPEISTVSPQTASINGGLTMTISGSGFQGNETNIIALVGGLECVVQSVSYTEVTCLTPRMRKGGIKSVKVSVVTNGNLIPAVCQGDCQVVYEIAFSPVVTSVNPTTLDGTQTTMTITGVKFLNQMDKAEVKIGGEVCSPTSVKDNEIQCVITNVPAGTQDVEVTITNLGNATSSVQVSSSLVVMALTPEKGSIHGGTVLTISGNGFVEGETTVDIGSTTCDILDISLSQVVCRSRSHEAANVTVSVSTNGLTYNQHLFEFSRDTTPTVMTINPASGVRGTVVNITGENFSNAETDNNVTIGGVACEISAFGSTFITCAVGAAKLGVAEILVDVKGKGLSNNDVTFEYALTVSSIVKNRGSVYGGQTVTVHGAGFDNSTTVNICDNPCVKDESATQSITEFICVTPAATGPVLGSQSCDVNVIVDDVTQTLTAGYTYDTSVTPTVSGVEPARGGTGGGVILTITGSSFGTEAGKVEVTIAGTVCAVTSVTDTQILCTTGQHSPSQKTAVTVQIDGNGIADQTNAEFYYIDVWSSPYTWGGGDPPEDGTLVVIPPGNVILLDQTTNRLKMILIKGGQLIFDEKDIELFADNILIVEGGKLQIGTETEPFQHKAIITGTAHHRTKELPIYGTNSLGVREGTLDLHGQPVDVWTRLGQTASAGTNQIVLQREVNWKAGDEIVIATTSHRHSQRETEKMTIQSVDPDMKTLTLTENLKYSHLGVSETVSGRTLDFRAEVGLLTRNIVLRGERNPQWTEVIKACPAGFDSGEFAIQTCFLGKFGEEIGSDGFGFQVMLHPQTPDKNLAIGRASYVEFSHVGQEFRLGRYPWHFHLGGNMNMSYIKGCSIHESFNRAVNIHGSHNTLVENNVAYNIHGGAFFLEDGIETGNTLQYNLVIFVRQSSSLLNDDVTPAGYWIKHPSNVIQHNAAAGGTHFGYWYAMEPHPEGPSFTTSICPQNALMGVFKNNTAHSFGWYGLWVFESYFPRAGGTCGSPTPTPAKFYSLYAWNCEKGAESVNTGLLQFFDFVLVNNKLAGFEQKTTAEGDFYSVTNGPLFMNGFIVGRSPTLSSPQQGCTLNGINIPFGYRFLIHSTEFVSFNEGGCAALGWPSIQGKSAPTSGGFEVYNKNLTFTNVGERNRGRFRWQHEGIMIDVDGTLSGTPGALVVPSAGFNPPSCEPFLAFSLSAPAVKCPPGVRFAKVVFTSPSPTSLKGKAIQLTNQYGSDVAAYIKVRVASTNAWSIILPVNESYHLEFLEGKHLANVSLHIKASLFKENEHLIFSIKTKYKPSCVSCGRTSCNSTADALDGDTSNHGDWYYDELNQTTSIMATRRPVGGVAQYNPDELGTTMEFTFTSYLCFFKDCIIPPDPNTVPPPTTRDFVYLLWSNASTWPNNTLPEEGDSVYIDCNEYRVLDTDMPPLRELVICGKLELDHGDGPNYRNFVLNVTYLAILGGRLIIGWEDQPFMGNVQIILHGSPEDKDYFLPGDVYVNMGSKVIGVYGGLDLHGKRVAIPWTTLNTTVNAGETTLTVNQELLDWKVGDEIVLTPTGYNLWETETFRITGISMSVGLTTISLNDTVMYKHLAYTDGIISIIAEVGLLTRNIKIEGGDHGTLFEDGFGGRIIVSESNYGRIFCRISNVQFVYMGQFGYFEANDPRYAISFLDSGPVTPIRPSYIRNCAFTNSFSPAIGVYGSTKNLPIENNVIHRSFSGSIITLAEGTKIIKNLIVLSLGKGEFSTEKTDYKGAVSAMESTKLVLRQNRVSGADRVGYWVPHVPCDASGSELYSDNVARSTPIGSLVLPADVVTYDCIKITGISAVKCPQYGLYYQNNASVIFQDMVLGDNKNNIMAFVIKPKPNHHDYAFKTATVKNVIMYGTTPSFDCTTDKFDLGIHAYSKASKSNPFAKQIVGVVIGTFNGKSNSIPKKPFHIIKSQPTIGGLTYVVDTTFKNFYGKCNTHDVAVVTNGANDDGWHPMETERITLDNVPTDNVAHFHRPDLGKVNPADCVDMDCDGLKKMYVKDLDGTLLGHKGAIIPHAEWEWDGNQRRGLGDYRIPKTMLTTLDGNRIPANTLAPTKGIIREKTCVYRNLWQAYECSMFDYQHLIIESMDSDSETRRVSPVAVLGHDEDGDGVIDLINGPQDTGWCSGYACRLRLSLFAAIVATDREYLIHFTGTSPRSLRYFLLNSDDSKAVLIGVWYSQPYRLDVYYEKKHIMPKNGRWKFGAYILDPPPPGQPQNYHKPDLTSDPAGANWFDRDSGILYLLVKGPEPFIIKTAKQIIVSFMYPAVTEDEFFGDKIVEYLAGFFNLPPSKVRVVDIVSAQTNGRRRKRSTGVNEITLEIGDPPSSAYNDTSNDTFTAMTTDELEQVYAMAVEEGQVGNYSAVLNTTITGVQIAEPTLDPSDERWGLITPSDDYRTLTSIDHLAFNPPITPLHEGILFKVQPKINAFDVLGNRVSELGTEAYPWIVSASIRDGTGNPLGQLLGNTTVNFTSGWANFTNLSIDHNGTGYIIDFNITAPTKAENISLASDPIDIASRPIKLVLSSSTVDVYESTTMTFGLELHDEVTGEIIPDIEWKGNQWKVSASLSMPELYNGTLTGALSTTFDPDTSQANFYSLKLTKLGMTVIKFHVTTVPAAFDLFIERSVNVHGQQHKTMEIDETSVISMKVDADYDEVVGEHYAHLAAMFGNWFANIYPDSRVDHVTLSRGSIVVTVTISGSTNNINSTLYSLCSVIEGGQAFTFNGNSLPLSTYMTYNAKPFSGEGVKCNVEDVSDDDNTNIAIIVACVCCALCAILVAIAVFTWKAKVKAQTKVDDEQKFGNKYKKDDLDEIFFAEKEVFGVRKAPVSTTLWGLHKQM